MKGGKRPNSGRKKKEPTTTVSARVKVRHAEKLKEVIKSFKDSHE